MTAPRSESTSHSETPCALSLQIAFAKAAELSATSASLFGAVWHADAPAAGAEPGVDIQVDMPLLLQDESGLKELWLADGEVREGTLGAARYRCNKDLLFIAITMSEQNGEHGKDIAHAAQQAYTALFSVMETEAFPHLVRCWNYFADINVDQIEGCPAQGAGQPGPLERYRLFNIGRQLAFEAAEHSADVGAPAACALGTQGGPLVVYALASRSEPRCVENPRQVSAYRYPERYGPKSPSFSRGSVLTDANGRHVLFVSGTASIIGHESVHLGDVIEQTRESLRNIVTVVTQANLGLGREVFSSHKLCYKVFVRHPSDASVVADTVRHTLGEAAINMVVLRADVCRAELLVEIEAVGFS